MSEYRNRLFACLISALVFTVLSCNSDAEDGTTVTDDTVGIRKDSLPTIKRDELPDTIIHTCYHKDLSNQFDIRTSIQQFTNRPYGDSNIVTVKLYQKDTDIEIQQIQFLGGQYYVISSCDSARSYETKKNDTAKVIDNYHGDLVVADFNFDKRSDFAVVRAWSPTMGPVYNFYLQGRDGKFKRNIFLSDSMAYFPDEINPTEETLVSIARSGAYGVGRATYTLNPQTGTWKQTGYKYEGFDERANTRSYDSAQDDTAFNKP